MASSAAKQEPHDDPFRVVTCRLQRILSLSPAGLYCAGGDFHIDPIRPVPRALITHGHSDHARPGHGRVLATPRRWPSWPSVTERISPGRLKRWPMARRCASTRSTSVSIRRGMSSARRRSGSASAGMFSSCPGDYKRDADPTCALFEPIACHTFITEATFGLPVFRLGQPEAEIDKLLASHRLFPERAASRRRL